MKTSLDIDREYDAGVDYSKSDVTDFSNDSFIEIDHEQVYARVEVAIKNGRFLCVNDVDVFHTLDSDGEIIKSYTNKDISMINITLSLIPNLYKLITEQAFEVYEDENDN